jgi:hypothetical protein
MINAFSKLVHVEFDALFTWIGIMGTAYLDHPVLKTASVIVALMFIRFGIKDVRWLDEYL